jgi:hypothetical protein
MTSLSVKYYFNRVLFFLTTPVLAVLLYLYGGDANHFDKIYIAALGLSCIFCWSDKDTLGALLILLGYWLGSEVLDRVPDQLHYLIAVYGLSIAICILYFQHITAKITLIIVLYTVAAEYLWWRQDYGSKPEIHYYVGLLMLTVWTRQLLFNRIFIADKYFNYTSGKTGLDTHAGAILYLSFVLILLMTGEYLVRHVGGMNNVTTIYYLYSFVSQMISGMILAAIYMHYFNNQSKKYLSA